MQLIKFGNHSLEIFDENDVDRVLSFVRELFSDKHTKIFFALSSEDSLNMRSFVESMALVNTRGIGIDALIRNNTNDYVGLLTCEQTQKDCFGHCWSVGITIHPLFRHQGLATAVLKDLRYLLKTTSIQYAVLDISEDDIYMQKAAKSANFLKYEPNSGELGRVGYFDMNHPEIGIHYYWVLDIYNESEREKICEKALLLARNKQYREAINLYQQALNLPEDCSSTWSTGQIYSNIGICYSSGRGIDFKKAYQYLKMAQRMGVTNPSVMQELHWLELNHSAEL